MANLRVNNLCGTGGRNAIDGSVEFTSSTGYLSTTIDAIGTSDFTIEWWFNARELEEPGTANRRMFRLGDNNATGSMSINYDAVNNDIQWNYDASTILAASTIKVYDSSWYHIAAVREGTGSNETKLYINGVLSDSVTLTTNFSQTALQIGSDSTLSDDFGFYGFISNLRVTKRAIYTAAFTPPTDQLTIVTDTILLCCQDSNNAAQEATGKTIYPHGGSLPSGDSNIIRNGDFSDGTTGWYGDSGASVSASGGVATVTDGGGDYLYAIAQLLVCRKGGKYRITGTIVPTMSTSTYQFRVRAGGSGVSWYIESGLTSGSSYDFDTGEVTADGTTLEIGSGNLANNSLTQFTLQNVVVTAIDPPERINEIPTVGVDEGVTFNGDTKVNSQGYMYFPIGDTSQRGRGRAVLGGGYGPTYQGGIQYMEMSTGGKANNFGELYTGRYCGGSSSTTRGLFLGGEGPGGTNYNIIDYVTIATTSNSVDFGDLTTVRRQISGLASSTRGVFGAGYTHPANSDVIDYATIASLGNAIDFGNMLSSVRGLMGASSSTRGVWGGGAPGPTSTNIIQYVTIASTGNATDFGDLTVDRRQIGSGGVADTTRAVFIAGNTNASPSNTIRNTIDYVTIASTGNATDFGDTPVAKTGGSSISNKIIGIYGGGYTPSYIDTVDSVTIQTTGNATNYGDLTQVTSGCGNCSDSHGGLE